MSHIERMKVELEKLSSKVASLSVFAVESNKVFSGLPVVEKEDMLLQLQHMGEYMVVLARRLERAEGSK